MPSTLGGQAGARLKKLATEIDRADKMAVNRAALAAKTVHLAELRKVAPSGRMRNVGSPPGAKLNVRYDVKGIRNPTALVRAIGPWHLLEHVIKPHLIIPKKTGRQSKGRGARRQNKQALYNALFGGEYGDATPLKTPFGPRFKVNHPGVRIPKMPWAKAKPAAETAALKQLQSAYVDAFKRGVR